METTAIDVLRYYYPQNWIQEIYGYEDATSIDVRDFSIPFDDRTWAEVEVTVSTYLGLAPGAGSGGLPPYIGWVRRKNSNTYANYRGWVPDEDEQAYWHRMSLKMAESGIHDCYMVMDEVGGGATITGYLYGYYDENQQIVYEGPNGGQLTDPASLQMCIVNVRTQATAVEDALVEDKVAIELSTGGSPLSLPCRILCSSPATKQLQVDIVDVTGRTIRSLFKGDHVGGMRAITWDGLNNAGRPVSSGIYWLNMQAEAGQASRRLVVVR